MMLYLSEKNPVNPVSKLWTFQKRLENRRDKPFGERNACRKITEINKTVKLNKRLLEKRMIY